MNFCKDCKHAYVPELGVQFMRCKLAVNSSAPEYLVTGEELKSWDYASSARLSNQPCGPEGKLWEAPPCDDELDPEHPYGVLKITVVTP
jgi:hypothetical protein